MVVGGGGGGGWLTATLVFILGPNLTTKTLLRPRPRLNNYPNAYLLASIISAIVHFSLLFTVLPFLEHFAAASQLL